MNGRYPLAKWLGNGQSGGSMVGGPPRGILHTTETTGLYTDYKNGATAPHFTVDVDGDVYQHTNVETAARALRNLSGGVQTNREGSVCIQIEIIGRSNYTFDRWPKVQVDAVVALMWWASEVYGIPWEYDTPYGDGHTAYGYNAETRMSMSAWRGFSGWAAHHNVPENTHWDIGKYLPVLIRNRMEDVRKGFGSMGVDDVFKVNWNEMRSLGIFSKYTDPDADVRAEELAAFLSRLIDVLEKREAAQDAQIASLKKQLATVSASKIAAGTTFTVKVV